MRQIHDPEGYNKILLQKIYAASLIDPDLAFPEKGLLSPCAIQRRSNTASINELRMLIEDATGSCLPRTLREEVAHYQ